MDDLIGPLHHAFLSEAEATKTEAQAGSGGHDVGNRGVENAAAEAIAVALGDSVFRSFGAGREEFTPEWAQSAGLMNAWDEGPGAGAAARRRQLCAALGLGHCSGAQLLAALNRYFTMEQVVDELEALQEEKEDE